MQTRNKQIILWFIAVIPFILTIIFYKDIPEKIPMHWNIAGEIDRYGDKLPNAFLMPGIALAIPVLMTLLPRLDPKKANYTYFSGAYYWIQLCFVLVFGVMSMFILFNTLGFTMFKVDFGIKLMIGIMFAVFGNLMPKLKHNYFVGVRTPWTLANEDVWYATHRLSGKVWFVVGVAMTIIAFLPGQLTTILYLVAIIPAALVPTVYSYLVYRKVCKGKAD